MRLIARVDGGLRVEITDGRPELTLHPRDANGFSVSGRGLHLVDELASRWGVDLDCSTKTVWFELDRTPAGDHPSPSSTGR